MPNPVIIQEHLAQVNGGPPFTYDTNLQSPLTAGSAVLVVIWVPGVFTINPAVYPGDTNGWSILGYGGITFITAFPSTPYNGGQIQAFIALNVPGGSGMGGTISQDAGNANTVLPHMIRTLEIANLAASPIDRSSSSSGTSAAMTSGTTAPTTVSVEMLVAWGGMWNAPLNSNPSVSSTSGYSDIPPSGDQLFASAAGGPPDAHSETIGFVETLAVTSAGAQTATALSTASGNWMMGLLTLKGVPPVLLTPVVGVASSKAPSQFEDQVTFTVSVTGTGGSPTGTVGLNDGVNLLAVLTLTPMGLNGAQAQFTTNSLTPGIHMMTASYSGDGTYEGLVSPVFLQQVIAVIIVPSLLPSFSLVASFSSQGDNTLPPTAILYAVPASAHAGQSVTLLWDTTNVGAIQITGNNGFDPPFNTGLLTTGGSGAFVAGNGFTHTIVLTMNCFDSLGHPLLVEGQTTVTIS